MQGQLEKKENRQQEYKACLLAVHIHSNEAIELAEKELYRQQRAFWSALARFHQDNVQRASPKIPELTLPPEAPAVSARLVHIYILYSLVVLLLYVVL